MSVSWLTADQLMVFFCSSIPVVLFDNPGTNVSTCSVESSSLLNSNICVYHYGS